MRIQEKPNGQFVVTVPKSMANAKDWEQGTEVEWKLDQDGDLRLTEVSEKE